MNAFAKGIGAAGAVALAITSAPTAAAADSAPAADTRDAQLGPSSTSEGSVAERIATGTALAIGAAGLVFTLAALAQGTATILRLPALPLPR